MDAIAEDKIIIDDSFITEHQKTFVEQEVLTDAFPWYYADHQLYDDGYGFMFHLLANRAENVPPEERQNSSYYSFFKSVLDGFCVKHNIEYKEIYRMCINSTGLCTKEQSGFHYDHDFPHRQLLVYLTDCPTSRLLIADENENVTQEFTPKAFHGISFTRLNHAIKYRKEEGRRIVVVYTFV